ncbi:MAG: hypothetical protein R6U22_01155 [Desulfohalobiaceae bacterium]
MATDYLHQLTRLRTDTSRNRWTEATSCRAPHKSLFLSYFWKLTSDIRHLISAFVSKMALENRPIFKPEKDIASSVFELIGDIEKIEVIAVGGNIRDIERIQNQYGSGRWRKLKGYGKIKLQNGIVRRAEIHWYEAHGIGKKENEN